MSAEAIKELTAQGKKKELVEAIETGLSEGENPQDMLNAMISAMDEIGEKFSRGECFVPEMLIAARAMSAGTEILQPQLTDDGAAPLGCAVIGTVQGDMHDIGKNLVRMLIEGKGIEIVDLGADVAPEAFVAHLKEHPECSIVCLSALLTTTMPAMGATVAAITDAGLRDQVKIMIGGAPVTEEFAQSIGADAYTTDAGSAAEKAASLLA